MSNITTFTPPKHARIIDLKYARFADAFARMGLTTQKFRAIGQTEDGKRVFVYSDELTMPVGEPLSIRGDMVEFTEQELL